MICGDWNVDCPVSVLSFLHFSVKEVACCNLFTFLKYFSLDIT